MICALPAPLAALQTLIHQNKRQRRAAPDAAAAAKQGAAGPQTRQRRGKSNLRN